MERAVRRDSPMAGSPSPLSVSSSSLDHVSSPLRLRSIWQDSRPTTPNRSIPRKILTVPFHKSHHQTPKKPTNFKPISPSQQRKIERRIYEHIETKKKSRTNDPTETRNRMSKNNRKRDLSRSTAIQSTENLQKEERKPELEGSDPTPSNQPPIKRTAESKP